MTSNNDSTIAKRRFNKKVLVLGIVALGALILAGIAGASIAWNLHQPSYPAQMQNSAESNSSPTALDSIGATSAEEISSLLDTAATAASGTAVSIDANRDGSWDVDLEDAPNTETTVRIAADGSTSVIEVDRDFNLNVLPSGSLSPENVARAVETALADTSGTIVGLSVDDGIRDVYSIDILSADGTSVTELDFDSGFTITERETDYSHDSDQLD